jgi:hypothetical protein
MIQKFLILFIAIAILATSCRKDRKDTLGSAISTDNSTAENLFSDMFKVVNEVSSETEGIREDLIECIDTIIVDTLSNPKSVLIDFRDDDCAGYDGRIRKGKLFITYTGRYREAGTIITVTPEDYTINGYQLQGQKTIENLGLNASGQLHYAITVNGTVTAPNNAWTISYNSDRIRTWIEGQNTLSIFDDVYEISGGGSGINRNGVSYTSTITYPLRVELACPWIVIGRITVEPDGYATRYIDFGQGECDSGLTVTVNGQVYQLGSE